jgi:hypothetical protein
MGFRESSGDASYAGNFRVFGGVAQTLQPNANGNNHFVCHQAKTRRLPTGDRSSAFHPHPARFATPGLALPLGANEHTFVSPSFKPSLE